MENIKEKRLEEVIEKGSEVALQSLVDWYVDILDNMIDAECKNFRLKLGRKYVKLQESYVSCDKVAHASEAFKEGVRRDVIESIMAEKLKGKRHINALRLIRKAIKQQWILAFGDE